MSVIEQAVDALQKAKKVVFFTGAGISADSGIPTYREKLSGLWSGYDPRDLETAKAFRENPSLVWGWYLWRRQRVAQAEPNAGHLAVSRMASSQRQVSVITQNVDDLHERAGSLNVVHLHGSLAMPECFACHRLAPSATRSKSSARCGRTYRASSVSALQRQNASWGGLVWRGFTAQDLEDSR